MKEGEQTLDLILASDPGLLDRFIDRVDAFLSRQLEDEEFVYQVVLLTSEAVTNGMEHGNLYDAEKKVFVSLRVNAADVVLRVSDEGAGFDREEVDNPLEPQSLLEDGGRGLFLIETMADNVVYEDGGRTIILTMNIPGDDR